MATLDLQPIIAAKVNRMLQDPKEQQAQAAILDEIIVDSLDRVGDLVIRYTKKIEDLSKTNESKLKNAAAIAFFTRALNQLSAGTSR